MTLLTSFMRRIDVLAKMGVEENEETIKILVTPNEMVKEMMCDLCGVTYGR